uniref:Uncharacterized protein n=1 Tax=Knipowitschia caucasica TaxID=637954 RepID=A0AAV2JCU8_KNICA
MLSTQNVATVFWDGINTGPFEKNQESSDQRETSWRHAGDRGVWAPDPSVVPSGPVWDHNDPPGTTVTRLGPRGPIWDHGDPSGTTGTRLGPRGPV